jgi:hypothetical protein
MRSRRKLLKDLSPVKDFFSIKGGPIGQATLAAHHDAKAMLFKPIIHEKISKLESIIDSISPPSGPRSSIDNLSHLSDINEDQAVIIKTLAIPDKGPKVRTISEGNYFLQRVLRPVHLLAMKVLRTIPEDGTYEQDKAAQLVKSWTSQGHQPWCFDLTSATDRFPIDLQEITLRKIFPELSEQWFGLMHKAEGYDITRKQHFVFEVGQPMGLFSSWPVFALTHHAVIRFAFSNVSQDFRGNYAIIGDDVAILKKEPALEYERLIQSMGVSISRAKSVTPRGAADNTVSGELAKRYFRNGTEISPIRPGVVGSLAGRGWPLIKEFIINLQHRWGKESNVFNSPINGVVPVLRCVDKMHQQKALLILSSPFGGPPLEIEGGSPLWWPANNNMSMLYAKLTVAEGLLEDAVSKLHEVVEKAAKSRVAAEPTLPAQIEEMETHPLYLSLRILEEDVKRIYLHMANNCASHYDVYNLGVNLDILDSLVSTSKSIRDYKSLKVKRVEASAKYTLDVWNLLLNDFGWKPVGIGWPKPAESSPVEDYSDW